MHEYILYNPQRLKPQTGFGYCSMYSPKLGVGDRVWLISRREKSFLGYFLGGTFVVSRIQKGKGEYASERFYGQDGMILETPIMLNDFQWFPEMRKDLGNFGLSSARVSGPFSVELQTLVLSANGYDSTFPSTPMQEGRDGSDESTRFKDEPEEDLRPSRVETLVQRVIRDSAIARRVKGLHDNQCQICPAVINLKNGDKYSEGHHIRPVGEPHNGPDISANILCVCPNCHVKLDYGVICLSSDSITTHADHSISSEFISYHNQMIWQKD